MGKLFQEVCHLPRVISWDKLHYNRFNYYCSIGLPAVTLKFLYLQLSCYFRSLQESHFTYLLPKYFSYIPMA